MHGVDVIPFTVNGENCYAIQDMANNKCFFYAYRDETTAREVMRRADFENNPLARYVNLSQDRPYQISDVLI